MGAGVVAEPKPHAAAGAHKGGLRGFCWCGPLLLRPSSAAETERHVLLLLLAPPRPPPCSTGW